MAAVILVVQVVPSWKTTTSRTRCDSSFYFLLLSSTSHTRASIFSIPAVSSEITPCPGKLHTIPDPTQYQALSMLGFT